MSSLLRIFIVFVIFALFGFATSARQTVTAAQTTSGQVTVFSAPREAAPSLTVGQPYSAVMEHEGTQTLADGTHITRPKTITKQYRDSQGRMRMEFYRLENGEGGETPVSIVIEDRVVGATYFLNPRDHTARLNRPRVASSSGQPAVSPVVVQRQQAGATDNVAVTTSSVGPSERPQTTTTTEDLGSQVMQDLVVQGRRITHVIPAGEQGNDRPITVVTERWLSQELNLAILLKTTDPRNGESTTRVTSLDRSEPDPSLFQVPPDYTIQDQP